MSALSYINALTSAIASILSYLAYQGGKTLEVKTEKGFTKITDELGKTIAAFPEVREKSLRGSEVIFERISGITTAKPLDTPQLSYSWKDKDVKLLSLDLIPDGTSTTLFRANGIIEILVNGVPLLKRKAAGAFTDVSAFAVPLPNEGITLQRGKKLEIFLWMANGATGAVTISGLVGDYE